MARNDGVRQVEDLRQRSRVDEVTDCWHWGLGKTDEGAARVRLVIDGKSRMVRGRRAALILSGSLPRKGQHAFARKCCESMDCVNPKHSRWGSFTERKRAIADRGGWSDPLRGGSIAAISRARAKLTDEQRAQIRSPERPTSELAREYGVSESLISHTRRAPTRQKPARSIFEWRPS